MDKKNKVTAKGSQKVTKLYSIDEVKALIESKEENTLMQCKDELINRINLKINRVGSEELSVEERRKLAEEYEKEEEILYLILESFNSKESIERVEKLRRITYDINRRAILLELDRNVRENNRFPSQTEIANQTGLSRKTIIKHLNEMSTNKDYEELRNTSSILLPVIMAQVYKLAMKGDVKAMKTFLDFHRGPTTTFIKNQQNNYDQTEPLEIKIVSTGVEMKTMEG